ncbi:hypothetical protein EZ449_19685 [Pedobacter frigidisoli]|uniref:Uncharacterized protein n=1 Tax=Pedobacter frigidisoli TaxID=2530455 RepID=A0A4R0NNI0_9SPHI|nr:hypothetical protein [Pedobacter frigidisoli]TCD00725.1 hypothetical protein EZ449_19685 [Pedobacter frigidisoli]
MIIPEPCGQRDGQVQIGTFTFLYDLVEDWCYTNVPFVSGANRPVKVKPCLNLNIAPAWNSTELTLDAIFYSRIAGAISKLMPKRSLLSDIDPEGESNRKHIRKIIIKATFVQGSDENRALCI